ncbi:MAG: DUF3006 domain-containing protein [Ruminococcus sp.]|nr:DUF3006 domain-containing protein [Ruminococcus sp.]
MKVKHFCVDRIENDIAVAYSEDGERIDVVPDIEPFKAGDMIYFDGECFVKDDELTLERKKRLKALKNQLADK